MVMKEIRKNVSLAPLTTFCIGGFAEYFVDVCCTDEVVEALAWAREHGHDVFLLGGGSNVVISDKGIKGLTLHVSSQEMRRTGNEIWCFAGCSLQDLIGYAQKNSLAGMEKMAGIPGSVGGAVRGNAGAFGTETKDCLARVRAVHVSTGQTRWFEKAECDFAYRGSFFKYTNEWIITEAEFLFTSGDSQSLFDVMRETVAARNAKQDQSVASAGSFFMNPKVDNPTILEAFESDMGTRSRDSRVPAGWLIDQLQLRGTKRGGAVISPQHSNYIINTGGATAADVIELKEYIQKKVREAFGVELDTEVRIIGA